MQASMGQLSYKSVRIIKSLGVISIRTKSFEVLAQHQELYNSENMYTVLWGYFDSNFAVDFMLIGPIDYEPMFNYVPNLFLIFWPLQRCSQLCKYRSIMEWYTYSLSTSVVMVIWTMEVILVKV